MKRMIRSVVFLVAAFFVHAALATILVKDSFDASDYAFRPRLRIRLTPGGRTFPGKPWVFGDRNSHPVFRYSCLHGHLYEVHHGFHHSFNPHTTLFYHCNKLQSAASVLNFSPDHLRRDITRPVSCYALFK